MAEHFERENKYVVSSDFVVPPLPGVKSAQSALRTDQLSATYYDSPDLRLARAHVTLRRRTGGDDAGWHLKLPVAPGAREEIHRPPSTPSEEGAPPDDLIDLVSAHLRGQPLKPVARIDTARTRWVARDRSGRQLAEVADDQIIGRTLGATTSTERWREIEVELLEGDETWLRRADRELTAAGATSGSSSKLDRVLADRIPAHPAARRPRGASRGSTAEVLWEYLAAQYAELLDRDPAVRRDAPDAVHKMRVATRRLRSTLRTFSRDLDQNRASRLDAELKWLASALGEVRDREVQIERFTAQLAELPRDLVLGPVQARVDQTLLTAYHDGRRRLLAALASDRYHALLDDLESFLSAPTATKRGHRPARAEVRRRVNKAHRRLDRRLRRARRATPGVDRDEAQHRARKAAKRLRYAAEVARPIEGKRAKKLAKQAESIQELLGDRQDAVVARGICRDLAVAAHGEADETSFTFGLLLGDERCRASEADRKVFTKWAHGIPNKYRL
ncbi:MAG TPA: CYTH and CHAD domain-containing protein [Mycobacteriales bacterium]|nr:CYTH and CHAD domain-containing protein [Mycobacteriales bacterium]